MGKSKHQNTNKTQNIKVACDNYRHQHKQMKKTENKTETTNKPKLSSRTSLKTSLSYALYSNFPDKNIMELLDSKCNVNRDGHLNSPIAYAIMNNKSDKIILKVLAHDNVNYANEKDLTPLMMSILHRCSNEVIGNIFSSTSDLYVGHVNIHGANCLDTAITTLSDNYTSIITTLLTRQTFFSPKSIIHIITNEKLMNNENVTIKYLIDNHCSEGMLKEINDGLVGTMNKTVNINKMEMIARGMINVCGIDHKFSHKNELIMLKIVRNITNNYRNEYVSILDNMCNILKLPMMKLTFNLDLDSQEYMNMIKSNTSRYSDMEYIFTIVQNKMNNNKQELLEYLLWNIPAQHVARNIQIIVNTICNSRVPYKIRSTLLTYIDNEQYMAQLLFGNWNTEDEIAIKIRTKLNTIKMLTSICLQHTLESKYTNSDIIGILIKQTPFTTQQDINSAVKAKIESYHLCNVIDKFKSDGQNVCMCDTLKKCYVNYTGLEITNKLLKIQTCGICDLTRIIILSFQRNNRVDFLENVRNMATYEWLDQISTDEIMEKLIEKETTTDTIYALCDILKSYDKKKHCERIMFSMIMMCRHEYLRTFHRSASENRSKIRMECVKYIFYKVLDKKITDNKQIITHIFDILNIITKEYDLVKDIIMNLDNIDDPIPLNLALMMGYSFSTSPLELIISRIASEREEKLIELFKVLTDTRKNINKSKYRHLIKSMINSRMFSSSIIRSFIDDDFDIRSQIYGTNNHGERMTVYVDITKPYESIKNHLGNEQTMSYNWAFKFSGQSGSDGGGLARMTRRVEEGEKPRTASLFASMTPESVTLEEALRLLQLPRTVGVDPGNGEEVVAANGRYGPYIKRGAETRSLETEEQLFTVTMDEALALIAQPKQRGRRAAAPPLRELGPDPVSGKQVVVKDGRFGPYVTDGEVNASLRAADDVETLTMERAAELLADRRERAPVKKKKPAARKAAPKKKKA